MEDSQDPPIQKKGGVTRRRFLELSRVMAVTGFALAAGDLRFVKRPSTPEKQPGDKVEEAVQTILEARRQIGEQPIAKAEAKLLIPHLEILFKDFTGSPNENLQIEPNNFFVTGDAMEEVKTSSSKQKSPAVQRLEQDYPGLSLEPGEESAVIGNLIHPAMLAFTSNNKIFVYLDKINDFNTNPLRAQVAHGSDLQEYHFEDDRITTSPAKPFTMFTSTILHEPTHLEAQELQSIETNDAGTLADVLAYEAAIYYLEKNPPDPNDPSSHQDHLDAIQVNFRDQYLNFFNQSGKVQGFDIAFKGPNNKLFRLNDFEEFFADYQMIKMSQKFKLPFLTTYLKQPIADFQRFDWVLASAGITTQELVSYHKKNQVSELFARIVRASPHARSKHWIDDDEYVKKLGWWLFYSFGKKDFQGRVDYFYPPNDLRRVDT